MRSSRSGRYQEIPDQFLSNFHTWHLPHDGRSLELQLRVVEWLNMEVGQGLSSIVKGAEVGGILLGRTDVSNQPRTIIEGFVPILCDYTSGYIYHLSAKDKVRLKENLAGWVPSPGKHLYAVGFYRCHNREGLSLDAEDIELANEFFPDPFSVFLLIKPVDLETRVAGFACWRSGVFQQEPTLLFPFSSARLVTGKGTVLPIPAAPSRERAKYGISATPEATGVEDALNSHISSPVAWVEDKAVNWIRLLTWRGILSVGVLLVVAAGAGYLVRQRMIDDAREGARSRETLDLKVEREGSQLFLRWDSQSPLVLAARRGSLDIRDGAQNENRTLDEAQLKSGVVSYANRTDDVTFRLHIMSDGSDSSEWIRVAGMSRVADAGRVLIRPYAQGWGGSGVGDQTVEKAMNATPPPVTPTRRARPVPLAPGIPAEAISGVIKARAQRERQVAPENATAGPKQGAQSPSDNRDLSYKAPQPVYRVEPFVPRSMRSRIPGKVRITVRVSIDKNGRVIRAEPIVDGAVNPYLTNLALDAARKWLFTPARRDNQDVPGELTLQFDFEGTKD